MTSVNILITHDRLLCFLLSIILLLGGNSAVGQSRTVPEAVNDLQVPVPSPSFTDTVHLWRMILSAANNSKLSPDSAIPLFMNTLQQSQQLSFNAGISMSALKLGNIFLHQSTYQKSIEMHLLSIRYAPVTRLGYQNMSLAFNGIANAYSSLEKPYYAAYYYYRAAYILNTFLNGERIEHIYCNLSNSLPAPYALYYLEKAESIARRKGNDSLLCITLSNKAVKIQSLNNNDSNAYLALQEALSISKRMPYPLFEYRILVRLGAYFLLQGHPQKALEYFQQAERLNAVGDQDISFRNRDLQLFGQAYFELKNYALAHSYFQKSLKIATALKLQRQLADNFYFLAKIAEQQGRFKEALNYQKSYTLLKDSFANETVLGNIQGLEVRYRTAEKDRELVRKEQDIEQKNILISGITAGSLLLLVVVLFYYRHSQQKQKLLLKEQELMQLKALMEGEEAERSRIARELHDGIMVNFSSVKMNLGAIMKKYLGTEQTDALQGVISQLDDATRELRKSAHNLMPDMLLREGLIPAIQYFCNSISRNAGPEIEYNHYGLIPAMPPEASLMLYRIVQELLQNVLKYASATYIIVQTDNTGELMCLTVEDNGKGFDQEILTHSKGSGLRNMQNRIKALGGTLTIETGAGKGTTIYIEIEIAFLQSEKISAYVYKGNHRG